MRVEAIETNIDYKQRTLNVTDNFSKRILECTINVDARDKKTVKANLNKNRRHKGTEMQFKSSI